MAFTIKQHDTRPAYVADLKDNVGTTLEAAIDLTDATSVTFKMRAMGATGAPFISRAMTIVSTTGGRVQHNWQSGDTATTGTFQVEFEIAWNDAGTETVPNVDYMTVIVTDDLDA